MDDYVIVPNHRSKYVDQNFKYLRSAISRQTKLGSNEIKTTKYSIYNFLPLNLFEQFHRFANVYFVFIAILNFVPQVGAIDPYLALGPPIFIITVTAVKDGYENYRRYKSDREVNCTLSKVYCQEQNKFVFKKWKHILVGDILELNLNDVIPADIVLLESSDENEMCFIETANLDGETNLKQKRRLDIQFENLEEFNYYISTQKPNSDLNTFQGYVAPFDRVANEQRKGLNNENIIYRGCILRNTDRITGLVVYAGSKTKAVMSNKGSYRKVSNLERLMNRDIILFAALLLILCISSAAASIQIKVDDGYSIWYIDSENIGDSSQSAVEGIFVFLTMMILFQILIPVSLYVSLELVKLVQVQFIHWDREIWSDEYNKGVECRSLNITEDLGCIEHVFCDKTGTLTENSMIFREFSINGNSFPHHSHREMIKFASKNNEKGISSPYPLGKSVSVLSNELENGNPSQAPPRKTHHRRVQSDVASASVQLGDISSDDIETIVIPDPTAEAQIREFNINSDESKINDFLLCLACCNTVIVSVEQQSKNVKNPPAATPNSDSKSISRISNSIIRGMKSFKKPLKKLKLSKKTTFEINQNSNQDSAKPKESIASKAESISSGEQNGGFELTKEEDQFINQTRKNRPRPDSLIIESNMPTINEKNVQFSITEATDNSPNYLNPNEVIYEAESPDEAALVYAAKAYGVTLMERLATSVHIKWPHQDELIKIKYLCVFPFDSSRKMMSVLIEKPNGSLLLTKGADSAIFSRLSPNQNEDIFLRTRNHVTSYSLRGLRTLCVAKRQFNHAETESILQKFATAETLLEEREAALQNIYAQTETDFELLGATAIEDRLQDRVPETIESLRSAGLSVWILTGDKMETAIEIARLCKLLKRTDHLIKIDNATANETLNQIESYLSQIQSSLPDQNSICFNKKSKNWKELSRDSNKVLAIDGSNLNYLLEYHPLKFIQYAATCRAVICCRTTPKSKAAVVKLCRRELDVLTLSIGDGANDVAMIRAANVGVGISGHEGRQAVMASDFALPRFYQLGRLLLVHGNTSYARMARMMEYFYYKNTVFILLLFWFQFFNKFSGSAMIPEMYLILFMLIFNSLPGMINGTMDQFVPLTVLELNPSIFQNSSNNKMFRWWVFWVTLVDSIWQSAVQYFIPYFTYSITSESYQGGKLETGSSISFYCFGTIVANASLFSQFLHLGIGTFTWTWLHFTAIIISYLLFYIFGIVSGVLQGTGQGEYYAMIYLLAQPTTYLTVLLTGCVSVLPRLILILYTNEINPSKWFIQRKKILQK